MIAESFIDVYISILLAIAIVVSYRLFIGPTIQDRLVSLSTVSVILVVILAMLSVRLDRIFYIDVAIAFILLDFVGTIAFTKYLGAEELE